MQVYTQHFFLTPCTIKGVVLLIFCSQHMEISIYCCIQLRDWNGRNVSLILLNVKFPSTRRLKTPYEVV